MTTFTKNSTQYANRLVTTPPVHTYGLSAGLKMMPFDCAAFNATQPVTIGLAILPPYSTLYMLSSAVWFAAATATMTLDIGYDAYKDADGVTVAADDDAFLNDLLMTTDATWFGGALITAAAIAQSLPIVNTRVFNNRESVVLYATLKVANPGADDTLNGYFAYATTS